MQENSFIPYINTVLEYSKTQPETVACTFQKQGIETSVSLTYKQLRKAVENRASLLLEKNLHKKNVALIFPAGNDFVVNFLACLLVGVVAVPLNLSRNKQQLLRTLAVLKDADVSALITMSDTAEFINNLVDDSEFENKDFIWIDESMRSLKQLSYEEAPLCTPETLAFIQYTSGSTSQPKGVMVTQRNIIDNQEAIRKSCQHGKGLIAGGWLPQFHDMGLIGHMLQPLYLGGHYVFMPPLNFIQRPRRWFELISDYKIESSASPNFGYEHCVKFISDREDLSNIDLSCWRVALNGSEPINVKTMERFANKFASIGFNSSSFFPCYGMAETTLFVSGGPVGNGVSSHSLDAEELDSGRIRDRKSGREANVICCGKLSPHYDICIVNPDTKIVCRDDEIGEIWLDGDSIAKGYWGNEEVTRQTFSVSPIGRTRKYLRTGDMGYIKDGSIYVTGRIKEMLIIRGRNIYPYDMERACNEHCQASGTAAIITYRSKGKECVAAMVEIKKQAILKENLKEIIQDIKSIISTNFEVTLDKVYLFKPGTIPKTTSGKVKRTSCVSLLGEHILEEEN